MAHDHPEPDDAFSWDWQQSLVGTAIVTSNDLFAALVGWWLRQPSIKVQLFTLSIAFLMLGFQIGLVMAHRVDAALEPLLGLSCVIFGVLVFLLLYYPIGMWLYCWANVRHNRLLQGPQLFEICDLGLVVTSEVSRIEYRWSAFAKVVETSRMFLFFMSTEALVIPKRAIPDPEEQRELRLILHFAMQGRVHLRGENYPG
jgi:hypothetical protein